MSVSRVPTDRWMGRTSMHMFDTDAGTARLYIVGDTSTRSFVILTPAGRWLVRREGVDMAGDAQKDLQVRRSVYAQEAMNELARHPDKWRQVPAEQFFGVRTAQEKEGS